MGDGYRSALIEGLAVGDGYRSALIEGLAVGDGYGSALIEGVVLCVLHYYGARACAMELCYGMRGYPVTVDWSLKTIDT